MAVPVTFGRLRPRRLLVRLPNWLGDAVMVTPALRALREHFREAEITLVGRAGAGELMRGADWCQRFETTLPRRQHDAAIVFPFSFRSAWEAWRAGIPARAGFATEFRGLFLTHALPPLRGNRRRAPFSRITAIGRLLEGLGIPFRRARLELPLSAEDDARAGEVLARAGLDADLPLVLVNPGSAWGPSKRWPEEYFAKAADRVAARLGAAVAVLAGPGEEEPARRIAQKISSRAAVLDVPLTLLKGVVRRATLLISNDSGPRHLAACFDVPAVVLVGPFLPQVSDNGHARTVMLYEGVECSPCHLRVCPIDHRCMTRITPEKVVDAALKLLSETRR